MGRLLERRPPVRWLSPALGVLSAVAGGIHLAVTRGHFAEDWLFGAFFLALGAWQVLWAVLEMTRPSPSLRLRGAETNVVVVLLWAVSRTVGVPFGPHPGQPEAIGVADVAATLLEVALVFGCVVRAGVRRPGDAAASSGPPRRDAPVLAESTGPMPDWLTLTEAAFFTGATEEAIRVRVEAGEIRGGSALKSRKSNIVMVRSVDLWPTPDRPAPASGGLRGGAGERTWVIGPAGGSSLWTDRGRLRVAGLVALATLAGVLLTAMAGGHRHDSLLDHLQGVHARSMAPATAHQDGPMEASTEESAEQSSPMVQAADAATPSGVTTPTTTVFEIVRGAPAIHVEGNPCLTLVEAGWTGSCQLMTMAGGPVASVVQRNPATGQVVAHVYTSVAGQDAWVLRLEGTAYQGAGVRSAVVVDIDLTGDGKPELVAGFRFVGSTDALSYEVVSFTHGSPPGVAFHDWLDGGSVVIKGSSVQAYCLAGGTEGRYLHQELEWRGGSFQAQALGEVAGDQVPTSQF